MTSDVLWTWNGGPLGGPLNQALHLASHLHGHTATIQLALPPTADARAALENAAVVEIGDAVLSTQAEGGPAARKLQRLLAEFDRIVADAHAHEKRFQDLDRQEQAAANDESSNPAKRLLTLARDREEAEAAAQESRAACEALNPLVQDARQAARRELAQAVKLRSAVAVSVLETRRHEVHAEILRLLSPCLSRLIAIEKALVLARSGVDLSQFARIPETGLRGENETSTGDGGGAVAKRDRHDTATADQCSTATADQCSDPTGSPAKRGQHRRVRAVSTE